MGKNARSTTMQVKTILFFCLALLVAVWAVTEVQELGNDDSHSMQNSHESANLAAEDETDSVGESAGVGRRGGAFLSTTGSFTLSSGGDTGGGNGEEEDELGESAGTGRRGGAFLSTTGSFTLSSGGDANAGNGEEEDF